jgi:hypothetical protein
VGGLAVFALGVRIGASRAGFLIGFSIVPGVGTIVAALAFYFLSWISVIGMRQSNFEVPLMWGILALVIYFPVFIFGSMYGRQ